MRKITIGFSTPKKFKIGSWIIKKFEGTEFSHIYIKMNPAPNSKLNFSKIFQASHGDVNAMTFDRFQEDNKILKEFNLDISDSQYFLIASWLWKQLGKPYSFGQLITIGLGIKNKDNGNSKFICSELAGMVLTEYLGYNMDESLDYVGLNDVKDVLESKK